MIYQSEYSRRMCKGILKLKKKGVIIHNGFDQSLYDDVAPKRLAPKMLVACAKWRGLKRPRSIVKGFLAAGLSDTVLVMIGEIGKHDRIKHKNVVYTGSHQDGRDIPVLPWLRWANPYQQAGCLSECSC